MSRKSVIVWNHRSTAETAVIGSPLDHANYNEFNLPPTQSNHVTNNQSGHVTNLPVTNQSLPQELSHSAIPVRSSGWFHKKRLISRMFTILGIRRKIKNFRDSP